MVIDKFDFEKTEFRLEKVDRTNVEIIQKSKGESEIPVAAASIIAKYTFEKEVDKLNIKYKYRFTENYYRTILTNRFYPLSQNSILKM